MGHKFWYRLAPKRSKPAPVPPVALPTNNEPIVNSQYQPLRVTDERDGEILNRGYAYYSQVWDRGEDTTFAFVGHADGHPRFFQIEHTTITRLGPLLSYRSTGEGMYWTASGDVMLCDGPFLKRVNPFTGAETVVLDISSTHPGCDLWQAHSSDDGRTHSATVRQIVSGGSYPKLGTVVLYEGAQHWFRVDGDLDESHISGDGHSLIIEESHNNQIILLAGDSRAHISNAEGALAHIDCGADYAVGEDDIRGACTYLNLRTLERRELFATWGMGHISVKAGRCLVSAQAQLALVDLAAGGFTPLVEHGMVGSGYDFQVHGNLDPSGRVAAWVSNKMGRMDLYLLRL